MLRELDLLILFIRTLITRSLCMARLKSVQELQSLANTCETTSHKKTILRIKEEEETEAVPKLLFKYN